MRRFWAWLSFRVDKSYYVECVSNGFVTNIKATFFFFCLLGSTQAAVENVTQHMTGLHVHAQPRPFVREGRIVVTE